MICSGKPLQGDSSRFCSPTCRHRFWQIQDIDAEIDWFACKLRQFIISQSWSEDERQHRGRPEWKRLQAQTHEICVSDAEAAV